MAATPAAPDDMITAINATPLVDIMLVLLSIFMLTANLITQPSIEVDLPEAATGEGTEPTTVAITLTSPGQLYLNGSPIDEAELRTTLPTLTHGDSESLAVIAADQTVPHGQVIHLIDVVRQAGIYKFALNVDPQPTHAPSID